MKTIYEIIKKLKGHEIRRIKAQFKTSPFEFEIAEKLFDLVTQYDLQDEGFYSQKLYNKDPDNTFRVAKSRLKRMLENAVLHDKSLDDYDTPSINARLQSKKRLLQGEIMLGRGAYKAGQTLLYHVISEAKRYDLTDEWFQAELLLYRVQSVLSSVAEFERQTQELLVMNHKRGLINEALILHNAVKNLITSMTLDDQQQVEVRAKVDRIRQIEEETGHPSVRNVYYLSEIYYLQVTDHYEEELVFCRKYLELLQKHPEHYSSRHITSAYAHLQQVLLQLGRLDEAREFAQKILADTSRESINYLGELDLCFRIEFYSGDYDTALDYVKQAFSHPVFKSSRMLAAKWHYYNACVLFQRKQYREAAPELNYAAPLLADKQGMNLYVRLLDIMLMYELGNQDLMDTRIQNMKQFLKRNTKNRALYRPTRLIQLLMTWRRARYEVARASHEVRAMLQDLRDFHEKSPFKKGDFELIRFELWLEQKTGISV